MVQYVYTSLTTHQTNNTTIPFDDTIPQNTEGTEVLTLAITPTKATVLLKIEYVTIVDFGAYQGFTVGLFQDTTANALCATCITNGAQGCTFTIPLIYNMVAGTTSATTFKIRVGSSSGNTWNLNSATLGTRIFGGVAGTTLSITEYLA